MALYDSFNLSNSTQVFKEPGIPLDALSRTLGVMEDRYMQSRSSWDAIQKAINSSTVHAKDRGTFDKAIEPIRQKIAEVQSAGNYEDMLWAASEAGTQLASVYAPFAQENALFQKRLEDIEKSDASTAHKNMLIQEAYDTYQGVKQDEQGRWVGSNFSGPSIAKAVEMDKFVRDALSNMVASSYAGENVGIESAGGGEYFVTRGSSREAISPDKVRQAVKMAYGLNSEVQDYVRQDARLQTRNLESLSYDMLTAALADDEFGLSIADKAREIAEKDPSISFGKAYRGLMASELENDFLERAMGYGVNNKAYEKVKSTVSIGKETADSSVTTSARKRSAELAAERENNPMVELSLNDAQGESPYKSYSEINEVVSESNTSIKELEDKLKKAKDPEDIDAITAQLKEARERGVAYSKARTAAVDQALNEVYLPNILRDTDGNEYSKEDIIGHIKNGKLSRKWHSDAVVINGKRVKISGGHLTRLADQVDKNIKRDSEHKAKTNMVHIDSDLGNKIGDLMSANPEAFVYYDEDGKPMDPSKIDDIRGGRNFKVLAQSNKRIGDSESTMYIAEYTKADGKKGRATFEAGNSNLDALTSQRLVNNVRGKAGENVSAAISISDPRVRKIETAPVGADVTIGSGKNAVGVRKYISDGGIPSYRLYDKETGEPIRRSKNGPQAYYRDAVEALTVADQMSRQ